MIKLLYAEIYLCLVVSFETVLGEALHTSATSEGYESLSPLTLVCVAGISVLLVVFIISLCGGCTPMEVGSDEHAASGGRKSGTNYGAHYDSAATDANTRVLTSGTTLPNDPYEHQDPSLPYALHPQGAHTANTFSGYSAPSAPPPGGMAGTHRSVTEEEPPPPYSQATAGYQVQQGNQQAQTRPLYHY